MQYYKWIYCDILRGTKDHSVDLQRTLFSVLEFVKFSCAIVTKSFEEAVYSLSSTKGLILFNV